MSNSFPIVLNSSNAVDASTYTYKFPQSLNLKNASIGLSQINLYYSWANINKSLYNNSEYKINFPDSVGNTEYTITIPDGNYTVEDLNAHLQSFFIANNKYLVNQVNDKYVYYMEFLSNPITYSIQLICHDIPTVLPTGYNNPSGGAFSFPATVQKPSLTVLSTNKFGDLIGFNAGTSFSKVSDKTPQMSPVSSVLVTCSLVNNKFTNPSNIIYSFVSGSTEYGRMLSVNNQDIVYSNIGDGIYQDITIKFIDNNFNRLNIKDTNLIIYLIVKINE